MRHLGTIVLKVELFAGTDIRDACCDLCELANRVGTTVEGMFNGVHLWAIEGSNPLMLVEAYEREIKTDRTVKIAKAY